MINENQLKDTTLDDSAALYQPRKKQTEKQKLSEMTFKEKVVYFNNYYKWKTISIIAVLALVVYAVYSILTPKPETVLYAAIINYAIDDETAASLQGDFGQHLGIDPETEEIMIDPSFFLGTEDDASEFSISNEQKLATYFYASEIDIIIAPESKFEKYAYYGNLSKLSDQLPTDLCSSLADSFYSSRLEDSTAVSAYGIYLDGATIYDKSGEIIDRPVLGIVANSKFKQNGIDFIRYLFKLY